VRPGNKWKIVARPAGYTYINKQKYGGATCKFINSDFPSLVKINNVKEKKNTQQATGYAWNRLSR
jgi:hypothetical protein